MTDINALKTKGIIAQKQKGYFVLRFLSKAGYFTAEEMGCLTELASKYGNGELGLTSRLTLEVPYIKEADIEEVLAFCEDKKLKIGGGGPTVRAILTCKGTVCKYGLADTNRIAREMDKKFLGSRLPGKFKISVLGCSNSYGKAQGNDLSFLAVKQIELDEAQCIHCKKCLKVCKEEALLVDDKSLQLAHEKCSRCGKCIPACPVGAIKSEKAEFLVFLGGRLGRKTRLAIPYEKKIQEEEILEVTERVLAFYEGNARSGERFAELIERIGLEKVTYEIF